MARFAAVDDLGLREPTVAASDGKLYPASDGLPESSRNRVGRIPSNQRGFRRPSRIGSAARSLHCLARSSRPAEGSAVNFQSPSKQKLGLRKKAKIFVHGAHDVHDVGLLTMSNLAEKQRLQRRVQWGNSLCS